MSVGEKRQGLALTDHVACRATQIVAWRHSVQGDQFVWVEHDELYDPGPRNAWESFVVVRPMAGCVSRRDDQPTGRPPRHWWVR